MLSRRRLRVPCCIPFTRRSRKSSSLSLAIGTGTHHRPIRGTGIFWFRCRKRGLTVRLSFRTVWWKCSTSFWHSDTFFGGLQSPSCGRTSCSRWWLRLTAPICTQEASSKLSPTSPTRSRERCNRRQRTGSFAGIARDQYHHQAASQQIIGAVSPATRTIPAIEPTPANVSGRLATIRPTQKSRYPTPYSFALPAEVAFTGRSATASRNICISSAAPASGSPICPPSATERQNAIMISNP